MQRPVVPGTQGDVLPPKRQAVVDRLRRRIENYRRHQSDCIPKFDQTFNGLVEQNFQDTLVLKQRFLENKAKRAAKKTDKKTPENNLQGNSHPVSKLMSAKRPAEEPPQPPQQPPPNSSSAEGLTKFSVEIVQQLEFTTCSSSSQISTNVTVKALNTSVKSAPSSRPGNTPTPPSSNAHQPQNNTQQQQTHQSAQQNQHQQPPQQQQQQPPQQVSFKQEIDEYPEFVDLDQCAAALEKDAAANGHTFSGFTDLIGDDTSDAIITSDTFKDLINEISDYPTEFMKDFADYDGGSVDIKPQLSSPALDDIRSYQSAGAGGQGGISGAGGGGLGGGGGGLGGGGGGGGGLAAELSPAAQTLKQMAEHHQHKAQMGMGFGSGPPPRTPGTPGQPTIKQEVMYGSPGSGVPPPKGSAGPTSGGRTMGGGGYSPYGSPRGSQGAPPPRPSSGPTPPQAAPQGPTGNATTLQISQAQQLHISSQGQPIQVSMAQNMSTDVKQQASSVSVAAHQGLFFSQHHPHHSPGSTPSPSGPPPPSSQGPPSHSSTSSSSSVPPSSSSSFVPPPQSSSSFVPPSSSSSSSSTPVSSTYCSTAVSQSQTINFTQQTMRLRPTANLLRPMDKMMMGHPQQQQVRPPPPDYQSQMHSMLSQQGGAALHRPPVGVHPPHHPSMPPHHGGGPMPPHPHHAAPPNMAARFAPPQQQRRIGQQPMPPSGPMMRPQQIPTTVPGVYMSQQPQQQQAYQQQLGRSQLSQLIDSPAEWRQHQLMMAQHQQQQPRPVPGAFHQSQGVSFSGGGVQVSAGQEQVLPPQVGPPHGVPSRNAHQQLAMHQNMPQMSINLHMAQAMQQQQQQQQFPGQQQFGGNSQQQARQQHLQQQQQHHQFGGGSQFGGTCFVPNSTATAFQGGINSSSMTSAAFQSSSISVSSAGGVGAGNYGPPQLPNDLNLDFLEQLPSTHLDTDLLNTLESGASFSLQDIL